MADPAAPFETWLLHRVAEVSAELLTELHDVMAEVRARPPRRGRLWRSSTSWNGRISPWTTSQNSWRSSGHNHQWRGSNSSANSWSRGWFGGATHVTRSRTGGTMAKSLDGGQAVPLDDVVIAQAFQLEASLNVLERQGVIKKAEVLEEIRLLREKTPSAR